MQKEIVAYPYICLEDWEAMNRRHPNVSNPKQMAQLKFSEGRGSCWPCGYKEFYLKMYVVI